MRRKSFRMIAAMAVAAVMTAQPLAAMAYQAPSELEVNAYVVPDVSGLAIRYVDGNPYVVWANQLTDDQRIEVEVTEDPAFTAGNVETTRLDGDDGRMRLYGLGYGTVYYIRAKIYEAMYVRNTDGEYSLKGYKAGAYSPVITYSLVAAPSVDLEENYTTASTVYFRMGNDNVTGYEFSRASGTGGYTVIAKTGDTVFKDKNLKSSVNYRYRIRTYIYDPASGQTLYGPYKYLSVTTWGSDLKVQAVPTGTTSVKVTWKKVTGATGYKIYRAAGTNISSTVTEGETSAYGNYRLMKTIKKASTTSYTGKNLITGMTYSYRVVAYKTFKTSSGKTRTLQIEGSDSATLDFDFAVTKRIQNKDGSVTLKWKKSVGADGFKIEKKDASTGAWVEAASLGTAELSYTFGCDAGAGSTKYRIYAYSGENISDYYSLTVTANAVDKPGSISATAGADLASVVLSWAEVPGAAYYKVYRSRILARYNSDADYYQLPYDAEAVSVQSGVDASSYPVYTDEIRALSATDAHLEYTYTVNGTGVTSENGVAAEQKTVIGNKGPSQGVRYYYYVQAYRSNGTIVTGTESQETFSSSSWYCTPASITLNTVSLKRPSISSVKSSTAGRATVSWSAVTGAQKYYVYYSTKKSSSYKYAGITTKLKYTVKNLTSGKKYYFRIKACTSNSVGADVYSSVSKTKSKTVK